MKQEVEILKLVTPHDNILTYLSEEKSSCGDVVSFVVELGQPLKPFLAEKPAGFNQTLFFIEGLFAGLSHIHSKGTLHFDLKPDSLYITGDSVLKISDFSCAQYIDGDVDCIQVDIKDAERCLIYISKHSQEGVFIKIDELFKMYLLVILLLLM